MENLLQPGFQQRRRWYDQDPGCEKMLAMINDIAQPDLRVSVITLCTRVAKKLKDDVKTQTTLPTMGLPGLRNRYLSRQYQRRRYDKDKNLSKLYDSLYVLPLQGMAALGFILKDVVEMLVIYSFACERLMAQPDPAEVHDIIQAGLHEGTDEATRKLAEYIGNELYEDLRQEMS